jgi:hypothetical protein
MLKVIELGDLVAVIGNREHGYQKGRQKPCHSSDEQWRDFAPTKPDRPCAANCPAFDAIPAITNREKAAGYRLRAFECRRLTMTPKNEAEHSQLMEMADATDKRDPLSGPTAQA